MADITWIKLATCMPDDEKMKLIDAMPERDTIHYVWIRILLLGGKINADGKIFLSEEKPLTAKMLAILFSRPLDVIKLALKVLSRFGMIEIDPDKIIRIVNWDKYQNIEGMERVREQNRKRAENHREKKKAAKDNQEEIHEEEALEDKKKVAKSNKEEIHKNEVVKEIDDLEENKDPDKIDALENLETSEEASENTVIDDKTNTGTNETSSNNIVETAENFNDVTKNTSNVTQNQSNVIVTEQNKKEIENKKKIKKEKKEIDKDKNTENKKSTFDLNNKSLTYDVNNKNLVCDEDISQSSLFEQHNNTKCESPGEEDINLKAIDLMHYHEKITGKVGSCDYVALRSAIDIHGEKWVKMAMDVGFERNCHDIKYAIGVLKNWRRDGYPEDDMEVKNNGPRSNRKGKQGDKNEFAGFKPKESRKLTEAERKRIQANLI